MYSVENGVGTNPNDLTNRVGSIAQISCQARTGLERAMGLEAHANWGRGNSPKTPSGGWCSRMGNVQVAVRGKQIRGPPKQD